MAARILIADKIDDAGIDLLRTTPEVDVTVQTGLAPEQLIETIGGFDALVVRSATKVTSAVLDAGRKLRVVGRAGVGVDNIDVEEATRRGIVVVNTAGGSTFATAEHTMAMLLAMARNVPQAMVSLSRGEWTPAKFLGFELRGKTLGIFGLGRIGTQVARRANAFAMRVIATDPYVSREHAEANGVQIVPLDQLLRESDILTLHATLTSETSHLIGDEQLAQMKRGARILNCARGALIDEAALRRALDSGRIAGAALDVFAEEPPKDSPLINHPKVVHTPHLAASSQEAQVEIAVDLARTVLACLRGEHVSGAVNAPLRVTGDIEFVEPYLKLADILGRTLTQLGGARLERVEVTYAGELAGHDVTPITAGVIKGLLAPISEERVNLINARLVARSRGLNVEERKVDRAEAHYTNLVTVSVRANGDQRVVAGTIVEGEPRLVRIDEYWVDVVPTGHVLIAQHLDRPGIIGRVGTLLGEGDVNISSMQVGRRVRRGEAIMIMTLDERISEDLLQQMESIPDLRNVKQVSL
ncbi:MAG TPA: phosphoglycerate dehydrogenase [Chloroflexota bacterium]|nr:phosphoglycerate dehydrogenase [Chloroflexota bacterium]